jgi:hypothetical protein
MFESLISTRVNYPSYNDGSSRPTKEKEASEPDPGSQDGCRALNTPFILSIR